MSSQLGVWIIVGFVAVVTVWAIVGEIRDQRRLGPLRLVRPVDLPPRWDGTDQAHLNQPDLPALEATHEWSNTAGIWPPRPRFWTAEPGCDCPWCRPIEVLR